MKKIFITMITILLILTGCSVTSDEKEQVESENIYKQYINKLEEKTVNEELDWDTVFDVTHQYDIDNFNFILFSNEFHSINEMESYGIANEKGLSVFLLNESFESGKDGTISDEKNLYIVKGVGEESFEIPVEEKDLLDLEEQISKYLDRKFSDNLEYDGPKRTKLENLENTDFDDLIEEYLEKN